MTVLSPGIAQGCFDLLRLIERSDLSFEQIVNSFSHFSTIRSDSIVAFAQVTGWTRSTEDGLAILTLEGSRLLSLGGYEPMLRQALMDHIDTARPAWIQCATYGRSRVMSFAGGGVAQLMVEAGLANGYDDDVVAFWDSLSARARGLRDASLSEIGRKGERLTLKHEAIRTGLKPKWIAINNNADGYDVLSIVDADDPRSLSIEVKASTQGTAGTVNLTRNEWEMAQERVMHVFHLWDIRNDPPRLAKISVEEMSGHVPADAGFGCWETLRVPFKAFGPRFEIQPDC